MDNGKFVEDGVGFSGVEKSPFGDLFSVRIKHDAVDKFDVYGNIFVEDEDGTFCIFNRQFDDASLITGSLPLAFNRSLRARSIFTLTFDLKDRDGNTIEGKVVAKFTTGKNGNFKKLGVDRIFGSMGCATIYYTFNQAAGFYAIKDAILMKHSANSEDDSWVRGTIVFQYGRPFDSRTRSLATQDLEDDCLDIVLFNATNPVPLILDHTGSCYNIPLLRSHLVVPYGYSSIMKFDLVYSDKGKVELIRFNKDIPKYPLGFKMIVSDKEGDDMLVKLMLELLIF
ncbi:uncharacterized protein LOC110707924 [Chenopodium quinoa]|uniref:uncharacterized protein LOC110707924 n=1 Tax=Chenopodium quinoa TaxID=63459 RepID=UPI000B771D98|nr:uncharacterized protein LOC110707924 [Chenopodium quinoa]XP_021741697.1 uncharacterized protein LOC110707924 [Chenopodium quinoa]